MSSLIDALLLEPPKPGGEVWITIRGDGVFGSGTQADPWNATPKSSPEILIDNISKNGTTATVTTKDDQPHGFAEGDMVTISGVTRPYPLSPYEGVSTVYANDIYYTGTFPVHIVDSTHFEYTMLSVPQSSTAQHDGTTLKCWRERETFDIIMRDLVNANTTVHLGPGIYETKGWGFVLAGSWQAKSGQKIRGSGIEITKLKIVNMSVTDHQVFAIGHDSPPGFLDSFEAADFTVDCNVGGQLHEKVACAACWLAGKHIRLRRLRAINFGTQTTPYIENFVFFITVSGSWLENPANEAINNVIEDCIGELPGVNNHHNSFLFLTAGGEDPTSPQAIYQRGSVIRNCYANGDYPDGSSSLAILVTNIQHIQGQQFKVTTRDPHRREGRTNIVLQGVRLNGNVTNIFNQSHNIDSTPTATEVIFTLTPAVHPSPIPPVYEEWAPGKTIGVAEAFMGIPIFVLGGYEGTAAIVEGNRIFNCGLGGPYQDTWSSRDITIRNNYYHNVNNGTITRRGGPNFFKHAGSTLVRSGTTATFTAPIAHGFEVGEAVEVLDAEVNGSTSNPFNGVFEIKPTPTETSFTYEMTAVPDTDATGSFKFARFWQVGRIVVEHNVVELMPSLNDMVYPPFAIEAQDYADPPYANPYIFRQVVVRGNVLRMANNTGDANVVGIALRGCEKALIDKNILSEFTRPIANLGPVYHRECGIVEAFNNRSSAGKLLPIFNLNTQRTQDELGTEIEETLLLALF